MGDSTHPTAAAPASAATIHPPATTIGDHLGLITATHAILDLIEEERWDVIDEAISPDPRSGRGWHLDPTLADLTSEFVATTIAVARHGEAPAPTDLRVFRLLGGRCGDARVALNELDETIDDAARALRQAFAAKAPELEEVFGADAIRQSVAWLCNLVDTLWRAARSEARGGREAALAWRPRGGDFVGAVRRCLSGRAESRPTVVPSPMTCDRPCAVAIFTGAGRDVKRRLGDAARAAELHLTATSAGVVASPLHARVVVEQGSRAEWQEATAMLREIARWHGLTVQRTTPVRFEELGAAYRDLRGDLTAEVPVDIDAVGVLAGAVA